MLARLYRTAKELKCSERERQAALELLEMLESKTLKYVPVDIADPLASTRGIGPGLNMRVWYIYPNCVGCMGGWMRYLKGAELSERCLKAWSDLFYPEFYNRFTEAFTPRRCAHALRTKLETGKAEWFEFSRAELKAARAQDEARNRELLEFYWSPDDMTRAITACRSTPSLLAA